MARIWDMSKHSDLFNDKFDLDTAIALMNLYAIERCAGDYSVVFDMARDIRSGLCRYAGCTDADVSVACNRFYNADILSEKP